MANRKLIRVKDASQNGETSSSTSSDTSNTSASPTGIMYREINLEEEFDLIRTLAEGCFAKVILAKMKNEKLVLKAIHAEVSSEEDFVREVHYNYFLSPHPNIVTSYNVSFVWDNCFVFVQEYAPHGDLSRFVKKGGLPEVQVKLVAQQLSRALDFVHSLNLVHRDLKLENVLVFKPSLTQVKLCDFGYTRAAGALVTKTNQTWIPFCPPELCGIVQQEKYYCSTASDVWQLGVLIYVCLTGAAPWNVADITDPRFCQYTDWLRRKTLRMPESFKAFTPRLIRLFKRLLEPKPVQRYEVREVEKYLGDDWFRRCGGSSSNNSSSTLSGGLTSLERKESVNTSRGSQKVKSHRSSGRSRSSRGLRDYGLDNDVDKNAISERVLSWISSTKNTKYFWDKL